MLMHITHIYKTRVSISSVTKLKESWVAIATDTMSCDVHMFCQALNKNFCTGHQEDTYICSQNEQSLAHAWACACIRHEAIYIYIWVIHNKP